MPQKYELRPGKVKPGNLKTKTPPGSIVMRPVDITTSPGKIDLKNSNLFLKAQFLATLGGQYNALCGVSEEHIVKVAHNIDESIATLAIQRLVKAAQITGTTSKVTQGSYMSYGSDLAVPQGNQPSAWTQTRIASAQWQDDGPKSPSDVTSNGDMGFVISDEPGLTATRLIHFPYALRTQFILRITVEFKDTSMLPQVADFHYKSYFDVMKDPFPAGYRSAKFIPCGNRNDKTLSFNEIDARYKRDFIRSGQQQVQVQKKRCNKHNRPLFNGICILCQWE
ncbi:MAG: hypothetical protein HRT37_16945 [Alteromonadaceae bacterium]|nr:hypothetical protein [Alteromonadaceae bacterium]